MMEAEMVLITEVARGIGLAVGAAGEGHRVVVDCRTRTERVEGAAFPSWVGDARTRKDPRFAVEGDTMTEHVRRPGGTAIVVTHGRVMPEAAR